MSNEIKPGQVWAWDYRQSDPFTIVGLHDGEVEYHYGARKAGHTVYVALPERIRERAALVKDVDAASAPLDPKSVHVGDTVTVRFKTTGDVLATKAYQPEDITKPGEWVFILGWPLHRPDGTFGLAFSNFEILAIEPAPEPEPEWADATFGDALVDGVSVRGFIANNGESFVFPLPDGGYHEVGHGAYSDFVPLVVIDRAAVDWRGLQAQMSVLVVGAEPMKRAGDILAVVRRELGIEAP